MSCRAPPFRWTAQLPVSSSGDACEVRGTVLPWGWGCADRGCFGSGSCSHRLGCSLGWSVVVVMSPARAFPEQRKFCVCSFLFLVSCVFGFLFLASCVCVRRLGHFFFSILGCFHLVDGLVSFSTCYLRALRLIFSAVAYFVFLGCWCCFPGLCCPCCYCFLLFRSVFVIVFVISSCCVFTVFFFPLSVCSFLVTSTIPFSVAVCFSFLFTVSLLCSLVSMSFLCYLCFPSRLSVYFLYLLLNYCLCYQLPPCCSCVASAPFSVVCALSCWVPCALASRLRVLLSLSVCYLYTFVGLFSFSARA